MALNRRPLEVKNLRDAIVSYLPLKSILSCARISKEWKATADSDRFYQVPGITNSTGSSKKQQLIAWIKSQSVDIQEILHPLSLTQLSEVNLFLKKSKIERIKYLREVLPQLSLSEIKKSEFLSTDMSMIAFGLGLFKTLPPWAEEIAQADFLFKKEGLLILIENLLHFKQAITLKGGQRLVISPFGLEALRKGYLKAEHLKQNEPVWKNVAIYPGILLLVKRGLLTGEQLISLNLKKNSVLMPQLNNLAVQCGNQIPEEKFSTPEQVSYYKNKINEIISTSSQYQTGLTVFNSNQQNSQLPLADAKQDGTLKATL